MTLAQADLEDFLKHDFHDALTGIFVGAASWMAHPEATDQFGVRGLGMFTTLVQARAVYEFYWKKGSRELGGTASAYHFHACESDWNPSDPFGLYQNYMANQTPAQKRVFHLVYGRSAFAGGTAPDESDHLKNQVLAFAKDLRRLTEDFCASAESVYRPLIRASLDNALDTGRRIASAYGISIPEFQ